MIEKNTYQINRNHKAFLEFKNDDVFIKSKQNFSSLYLKLTEFQKMIDQDFRPEIENTKIEKGLFVKKEDFSKVFDLEKFLEE